MGVKEADQLEEMITAAEGWPVWQATGPTATTGSMGARVGQYNKTSKDLELWVALREADRDRIKGLIGWPQDREYKFDPLADRITQAFSDLLYGEDPEFKAAEEDDQEGLDEIVKENDLPSELRRMAADCSAEGEQWYRIYVDPAASERPLVEFHSRLDVVPLFKGRRIVAAAFISHLSTQEIKRGGETDMVQWRHVEIQTDKMTRNLLFRGNLSTLGKVKPLSEQPETADLPEEWNHGLDVMLAGRVVNKVGRDWRLGVSDFQNIKDQLLDLNEARVIMAENARLTAKSRMVVPLEAINANGTFDAGSDVIVHESINQSMDDKNAGPYAILQYTFEAGPLNEHINQLRSTALTGVGLMEQFIGSGDGLEGNAGASGTSLKTRLIPTTLAAAGRGRFHDDVIPEMLRRMQMVDALPEAQMGLANKWKAADKAPTFERTSVLPEDPNEETDRHVAAVGGEIESRFTAVKALHPDWDDDAVNEELDRIKEDAQSGAPIEPGALPGEEPKPGAPLDGTPAGQGAQPPRQGQPVPPVPPGAGTGGTA